MSKEIVLQIDAEDAFIQRTLKFNEKLVNSESFKELAVAEQARVHLHSTILKQLAEVNALRKAYYKGVNDDRDE